MIFGSRSLFFASAAAALLCPCAALAQSALEGVAYLTWDIAKSRGHKVLEVGPKTIRGFLNSDDEPVTISQIGECKYSVDVSFSKGYGEKRETYDFSNVAWSEMTKAGDAIRVPGLQFCLEKDTTRDPGDEMNHIKVGQCTPTTILSKRPKSEVAARIIMKSCPGKEF